MRLRLTGAGVRQWVLGLQAPLKCGAPLAGPRRAQNVANIQWQQNVQMAAAQKAKRGAKT